jgi:hypothetical protein
VQVRLFRSNPIPRAERFLPLPCDRRARGGLVLAHTPRRALLPVCPPGACSSSAGHCCAPSFAVEVIIVDECRISVPCGAALLLLPALNICCHSCTCGCLACTLRGSYVCFVPRAVVSVDGLAQCAHALPLVASHAQLQVTDGLVYIDELFIKRYFSSLFLSRRAPCRDDAGRSVGQWRWRWRR